MCPYLGIRSLQRQSSYLGRLTDVLIKKGKCGHRHTQREDDRGCPVLSLTSGVLSECQILHFLSREMFCELLKGIRRRAV